MFVVTAHAGLSYTEAAYHLNLNYFIDADVPQWILVLVECWRPFPDALSRAT